MVLTEGEKKKKICPFGNVYLAVVQEVRELSAAGPGKKLTNRRINK